jgi:hypothetical protein
MTRAQELIAYQRSHRNSRAVGAGTITDVSMITSALVEVLEDHIRRTLPAGLDEHYVETMGGRRKIEAVPPPPWVPELSDTTAMQLAMLLSHLQDSLASPRDELAAKRRA